MKANDMNDSPLWSDYTIVVQKREHEAPVNPSFTIALEWLASTKKGKLVINPIYRIFSRSKDGVHLWRRREHDKWELECVGMLKAMPLDIFIPSRILDDIKNRRISREMEPLLRRGVVLEVPNDFV